MMTNDSTSDNGSHKRHHSRSPRSRHGRRKERVLHTRVSEPLAEDIRRMAEDLRVPVSNLVRNVLEEAFSVVEAVSENVGDLIDDVVDEAERTRDRIRHRRRNAYHRENRRARSERKGSDTIDAAPARDPFPQVVGWQPLILNQLKSCADCEEPIEKGERGFAGVTAARLGEIYLCRDCMDARH